MIDLKSLLRPPRPSRSVVDIGWTLGDAKASLIWDDPEPVRQPSARPPSAKSVQVCPAAIDFDTRHFMVKCPIDLHLRLRLDGEKPHLENVDGARSTVRTKTLSQMLSLTGPGEWRHPERPIVQVITPYLFLTDAPVYISQLAPYLHYVDPPWPGVLIGGRFPLDIWPRHLMWAFEWHDPKKDLVLKRDQPWFYVRFETENPASPIRLFEAEMRPEVQAYVDSLSGVTNYVNRTFSLFERARRRRPKRLLFKKDR